ncbi:hypothetical protein DIPPA_33057 [Diplonema papillatum]|nr:hypothetical protein DIPPA_33057 [Diplonema papillatum]
MGDAGGPPKFLTADELVRLQQQRLLEEQRKHGKKRVRAPPPLPGPWGAAWKSQWQDSSTKRLAQADSQSPPASLQQANPPATSGAAWKGQQQDSSNRRLPQADSQSPPASLQQANPPATSGAAWKSQWQDLSTKRLPQADSQSPPASLQQANPQTTSGIQLQGQPTPTPSQLQSADRGRRRVQPPQHPSQQEVPRPVVLGSQKQVFPNPSASGSAKSEHQDPRQPAAGFAKQHAPPHHGAGRQPSAFPAKLPAPGVGPPAAAAAAAAAAPQPVRGDRGRGRPAVVAPGNQPHAPAPFPANTPSPTPARLPQASQQPAVQHNRIPQAAQQHNTHAPQPSTDVHGLTLGGSDDEDDDEDFFDVDSTPSDAFVQADPGRAAAAGTKDGSDSWIQDASSRAGSPPLRHPPPQRQPDAASRPGSPSRLRPPTRPASLSPRIVSLSPRQLRAQQKAVVDLSQFRPNLSRARSLGKKRGGKGTSTFASRVPRSCSQAGTGAGRDSLNRSSGRLTTEEKFCEPPTLTVKDPDRQHSSFASKVPRQCFVKKELSYIVVRSKVTREDQIRSDACVNRLYRTRATPAAAVADDG